MNDSTASIRCTPVSSRGSATMIFFAGRASKRRSAASTALNRRSGSFHSRGAPSGSSVATCRTRSRRPYPWNVSPVRSSRILRDVMYERLATELDPAERDTFDTCIE